MNTQNYKLLLHGIDTLQCAYYLKPIKIEGIDFYSLAFQKEKLRKTKKKNPKPITLGSCDFFLQPYGSSSGYPIVITNENFKIECGQYNNPNFFVTFRSQALWRESAFFLHEKFLKWASSVGFAPNKNESLSRIDFSFDYHLTQIDFDEDSFISRSAKDSQFRENGKVQTFNFGKNDIRLRVYNKIDEIKQKSSKAWFYKLWGKDENVWRIEWQVRKQKLKDFGINSFDDLKENQGDLLKYLSEDHDTLRVPNNDRNPSRWPLHELWKDLQEQISKLDHLGISKIYGKNSALEEREMRIGISILGYLKRYAAIGCVKESKDQMNVAEALRKLQGLLLSLHEPLTWKIDVEKRIKEIELGEW